MNPFVNSYRALTLALLLSLVLAYTAAAQNNVISVSPTSLSFCVTASNSPAPPAQMVTVSSTTGDAAGYNANAFPRWIKLNGVATPPSISGDTSSSPTFNVTIDPSGYSSGAAMQSGTIQVQSGATSINIPVSLAVTAACGLTTMPSTVNLFPAQPSQSVTVNGPAGALIVASPMFGNNNPVGWFTLSAGSLTAGQSLTVSLATTNIPTGTTGSILFTQYGTSNTVSTPVVFSTTAPGTGIFTANPSSLNLTFASLQAPPQTQIVTINGPIASLTPSVDPGTAPNGWITVSQQSGVNPITFSVTVNPANLSAGVNNGSVTFTQVDNPDNSVTVPVSATVGTQVFSFTPNPLNFAVPGGSPVAQGRTLRIIGPNNSQVVVNAHVNNGLYQWLTVNGSATLGVTLTNSTAELTVFVNPIGLPPNQMFSGTIFVNQGSSTVLSIPVTVSTFAFSHLRDFPGNGLSGALLYNPPDGTAYAALSNGAGAYSYVYSLISPGFDTLRTGDFNGDGKADLVVYNSQTALGYIGLGNGDGTFGFHSLFWSAAYDFVVPGDLNGDGKTDLVLYNSGTGTMYTAISDGSGGFTYKYGLVSPGFTFVRLADFTGDGKADVILYNRATGAAYAGVGDGTGSFAFHSVFMSPGYDLLDVGDVNGDGRPDIIAYNSVNGNAATGISSGLGSFAFTPLLFSPGFTSVRLADYTGDGFADLTLYNRNSGAAYFGLGAGNGKFSFQSLFWSPGYDWVEPEDVSGDGRSDVILYNSATGTEYTGVSNGDGTFTYTYSLWGPGKLLAQ